MLQQISKLQGGLGCEMWRDLIEFAELVAKLELCTGDWAPAKATRKDTTRPVLQAERNSTTRRDISEERRSRTRESAANCPGFLAWAVEENMQAHSSIREPQTP